jgi:hypothetical protein
MTLFYTPSEKTRELMVKVHADREKKIKWKYLVKKYKVSRAWLAAIHSYYTRVLLQEVNS